MIVIHPQDKTTDFLKYLYDGINLRDVYKQYSSKSRICNAIKDESDIVMMLGHGNTYGLLSKQNDNKDFDRLIVNSDMVYLLREKTCIGIWCNANLFAEKYNLHGLFSGMIISEMEEAYDENIETTEEELYEENLNFAENLKYCLNNYELSEIPERMKEMNRNKTPLTEFNYNNIYYF